MHERVLQAVKFTPEELIALLVAISFAAGLNVYATVLALGVLARAGMIALPASLHILTSWYVIAVSGVLFAIEFFGDKIPAFDLVWNALHTFIRVPVAALIAYHATATLSPWEQLAATLAGGAIALAAHGGKRPLAQRLPLLPSHFQHGAQPGRRCACCISDVVCHEGIRIGRQVSWRRSWWRSLCWCAGWCGRSKGFSWVQKRFSQNEGHLRGGCRG